MASRQPNILLICTDQQRWDASSFNDHPLVRTPSLQRLADRGTNFRACYSNSPVCVPGRAALMTGRYPSDVGAYDNGAPFDGRVPTFANVARDHGYYCTATGKLDMCEGVDYGFEEYETGHGHDVSPDVTAFFRNPICIKPAGDPAQAPVLREGPPTDRRFMLNTLEFVQNRSRGLGRPWLAWTGWGRPHNPYRTSQEMLDSYPLDAIDRPYFPEDWRDTEHPVMQMTRYHRSCTRPFGQEIVQRFRAAYYGAITELDGLVGELVSALEDTGQLEDTVVIFTSDHGDMMGDHGFFYKNAPYDGCARVPLIIAGPGIPAGCVIDTPVSLVDVYASVVDLVGGPGLDGVRGHSLIPLAQGDASGHPYAYVELNTERLLTGVFSVIQDDWKYNYYVGYPDQLFNLRDDPDEWINRMDDPECAAVRDRLKGILYSIVDPDVVSDQAFVDQERRLNAFIGSRSLPEALEEEFLHHFSRRLGEEQARELLTRHFRKREAN